MIADEIKNKILSYIEEHFSEEEVSIASSKFQIEIPDSPEKGNLTCNIALILGNITKNNPKEIGLEIGNIIFSLLCPLESPALVFYLAVQQNLQVRRLKRVFFWRPRS